MTITATAFKYAYVYQDTNPITGSVNASYPSTGTFGTCQIDKPVSGTRAKPKDLFMGSTARIVSQTYWTSTFGTVTASPYTRYINMPFSNYYYASSALMPVVSRPDPALMRNQLRNQLRGTAANLAMAMAEYRQTAKLFGDSAKYVANGFTSVPKIRGQGLLGNRIPVGFDNPKNMSKKVAKRYLAYQYGVKPLCSDIISSLDEMNKAGVKPIIKAGVVRRKSQGSRSSVIDSNSGGFPKANAIVTDTYLSTTRWRAVMKADSVGRQLTRHGFTNPFALAYELIPYSFVLDWWVNVGEVLASLDNLSLVQDLYVIESYRRITITEISCSDKKISGASKELKIYDFRGGPTSISVINTLQYKPSPSLTHIMNGLALLRVARGGR